MGGGSHRWRRRLIVLAILAVLVPLACVAMLSIYRVVAINRMAARVATVRTPEEEVAAFRAINGAAQGYSGLLFGGYSVRLFGPDGRRLDHRELRDFSVVHVVEIEWGNGTRVRKRLTAPGNLGPLLDE